MRKPAVLIILFMIAVGLAGQDDQRSLLLDAITKYGQAEVFFDQPGHDQLAEISRSISVSHVREGKAYAVLLEHDIDYFLSLNLQFKLVDRAETKSVLSALSVAEAMNWDVYPTYFQYDTIMHKFATEYPEICRVDTIGESMEGRLILALKISDNVSVDENEPEVFYSSTMHVLMLRLADHLLKNSANGGLEQKLVDSLEIWVNPLSNPDGTYIGGDTILNPIRYNSAGQDLNRGFPDPTTAPFTIPAENVYMMSFIRERRFVISANFHSGMELLNFPWDKDWDADKIHADSSWFNYICRKYADTVHVYSGSGYMNDFIDGVTRGDAWLEIYRSRQDWVTYETQGREVTIELDDIKQTGAAQLNVLWDYNYRSLLMYLENAIYGIHGRVTDIDTELPVGAKIFIAGHDADSSHVYSDTTTGVYLRLLDQGSYDLVVSADGYNTKVINNVNVGNGVQTRLDITLQRTTQNIKDSINDEILIWPVPASDYIQVRIPSYFKGELIVTIASVNGSILKNQELTRAGNEPLYIVISDLPSGIFLCTVRSRETGERHTGRFIRK